MSQLNTIDNIEISTKTIITNSNIDIDLDKFFRYIPITSYTPIEKKRGRKKKSVIEQEPQLLTEGSIITLQKGNEVRGVIIKKKRQDVTTYFLHSVSVVLSIQQNDSNNKNNDKKINKFINIKVSSNGNFQITGCKTNEQCFKTIQLLYKHIKNAELIIGQKICKYKKLNEPFCYSSFDQHDNETLICVLDTVMQNMDYNIGFDISREKLNTFINSKTNFTSIFEGSIGTGVNIKILSRFPYEEYLIKMKMSFDPSTNEEKIEYDKIINSDFIENEVFVDNDYDENDYEYEEEEYKQIKKIKEYLKDDSKRRPQDKKKINKDKYHTFLVFASGSIIMSSRGPMMKEIFKELVELLLENKDCIVEKIN
jgi:hypothetical protein